MLRLKIEVAEGDVESAVPEYKTLPFITLEGIGDEILFNGSKHPIVIIGRATKDIRVQDPFSTVSGKHGGFLFREGKFFYVDSSSNGSIVNGNKVKAGEGKLSAEIEITEGKITLIQMGQWNPDQAREQKLGYYPIVRVACQLIEKVESAKTVLLAEMELTSLLPNKSTYKDFYLLEGLSNNFMSLSKVKKDRPEQLATKEEILVGRGVSDTELRVAGFEGTTMKVSNVHGAFSCHDGILMYQDLDSANGSFVNGERIPAALLHIPIILIRCAARSLAPKMVI